MNLAKNSLWLLLARIGTQGMAALSTILLARRLGSAGFGEYTVIAAIVFISNMLTTFGTDMSLIREIAAHDDLSLLPAALYIQLGLSFPVIILIWLAAPLLPIQSADGILALRLYILVLIPLAGFTVFTSALRGRQAMGAYAALNLMSASIQFAALWIFMNASVARLAVLLLAVQIVTALAGAAVCHFAISDFWRAWRFDAKAISHLLKISSPFAVLTVLAMLYQRLGILMLAAFGGPLLTGLFSAAQRTVEGAKTAHGAVFTALYPAMAQSRRESFHASWRYLLGGAGFGAISLSALAMPLTRALFGVGYEASVPVLQILSWTLIPYTVGTFLTLKFAASKRTKPILRASLVSLLALALLGLWLIPKWGLRGAGATILIAETLQTTLLAAQWRQNEFSEFSRKAHA